MKISFYQELIAKGFTRRDFMIFCTGITATLGLDVSFLPKVVKALETKSRPPVIWEHFQECSCCSESFIRGTHPVTADIIMNMISLDYHLTLQAASGFQAEDAKNKTIEDHYGEYILAVEGSIPTGEEGNYCTIAGHSALELLEKEAKGAAMIISWGSCASNGCVQAADPNPTNAKPVHEIIKGKTIINVPGCPPIPDVMAAVIVHILTFGAPPELDGLGRPKAFYGHRIHDNCNRRAYFDAGLFVEKFDDEGARNGWCLYKMGCKGPTTYNSCAIMRWNGGVSFPILSGHPCIGCSEDNFWDNGPFYTKLADRGSSIISDPVKLGAKLVGATAVGVAAHAVATAIQSKTSSSDRTDQKDEFKANKTDTSLNGSIDQGIGGDK